MTDIDGGALLDVGVSDLLRCDGAVCDAVVPSAESPLLFADGVTDAVALGSVGLFWEIQVQRAICTPNR
jgi:hypothetical protein